MLQLSENPPGEVMYILKDAKYITLKTRSKRQEEIITCLLEMDDIPYSLYGVDGTTRINIPVEYMDKLETSSQDWLSLSNDFSDFFNRD
jgi:hypothetical protein